MNENIENKQLNFIEEESKEEKYYKVYVPVEVKYRKKIRIMAALRDMKVSEYMASLVQNYLDKNHIDSASSLMR